MQGVGQDNTGILVLGATNTPWELDPAIRRRFEKRVYIPLPEKDARVSLFKNNIGVTPHSLSGADFNRLGDRTEGFSGSDISVVVRDALYEPVRTCQVATHFKKVRDSTATMDYLYEACSPADPEGEEITLMDVPSDRLKPMDVNYRHFESALKHSKSSVSPQDLQKFEDWTKQFGQDG